jgi:exodeoxyribonuclease VII small subunit
VTAVAATTPDGERPSYEQAREELVDVVRRLETGAATLEESLALWERGEALAAVCQEWLDGARAKLDAAAHAAPASDD